jgi:hypothetical protein
MNDRRLVGIDLGIATAHAVRVLDGEGTTLAKRKALPTLESLAQVEAAALNGTPLGTRLEVVIEPTGPAWLPIAVFFISRGHLVYRGHCCVGRKSDTSPARSAGLRVDKHAIEGQSTPDKSPIPRRAAALAAPCSANPDRS